MTDQIFVKSYNAPPVDRSEILRYMGTSREDEGAVLMMEECLSEILPKLVYKTCYSQFAINVDICNQLKSKSLAKNLGGCCRIVMFAATIGMEADRLIAKYGRLSPSKALCIQAIGAERIESLCSAFNDEVKGWAREEGLSARPRFSPGYGDFSLEAQSEIFRLLDCPRKIGLSLSDSLIMSPSKSVTALIGLCRDGGKAAQNHKRENSCTGCKKSDCSFRR